MSSGVKVTAQGEKVGKMYFGTYRRTVDEKGRLQIPPKLLSDKNEKTLYVLKGFEGCLSVYPPEAFDALVAKLQSLSYTDEASRAYIRVASASIVEMTIDAHGRISLGKELLESYKIKGEVTLVGVIDHFEIWEPKLQQEYFAKASGEFEKLAGEAK